MEAIRQQAMKVERDLKLRAVRESKMAAKAAAQAEKLATEMSENTMPFEVTNPRGSTFVRNRELSRVSDQVEEEFKDD